MLSTTRLSELRLCDVEARGGELAIAERTFKQDQGVVGVGYKASKGSYTFTAHGHTIYRHQAAAPVAL